MKSWKLHIELASAACVVDVFKRKFTLSVTNQTIIEGNKATNQVAFS